MDCGRSRAKKSGAVETAAEFLARRAKNTDANAALALLDRAPNRPPIKGDEI